MRYLKRLGVVLLLVLCIISTHTTPALAIADPDTALQVSLVEVYENLLEDGDCGVLIDYYIDYTVNPTENADEAFMAIFIDTDGTTQLKTIAPYAFDDDGYGRGIIWIYFDATEVVTHSLDVANEDLYEIWFTGNPTLDWTADPPITIAGVDDWIATGDMEVIFPEVVLNRAAVLGTAWDETLYEAVALGNRLTAMGETYFTNAIQGLRLIAPNAFSDITLAPTLEDIDYSTIFGAVMTDGTGTIVGSPVTLVSGNNTITVTGNGTLTVELEEGTVGTATSGAGGAVVTNSPVDLVFGTNTITVTMAGTNEFITAVALVNTQTVVTDTVTGTGLDLTTIAAMFGMTTRWFSGLVWLVLAIVFCVALFRVGAGRSIVWFMFNLWNVGGVILGLLPVIVAILIAIFCGAGIGYIIFFRHASV